MLQAIVWPLVVALVVLFMLRRADAVVQPIVVNVVNGIAKQAGSNALTYGLAIGYGLSASLQSLSEQATLLHWPVVAAAAKVINPCIVAMLAFAAKSDLGNPPPKTTTTPPFTPPTS